MSIQEMKELLDCFQVFTSFLCNFFFGADTRRSEFICAALPSWVIVNRKTIKLLRPASEQQTIWMFRVNFSREFHVMMMMKTPVSGRERERGGGGVEHIEKSEKTESSEGEWKGERIEELLLHFNADQNTQKAFFLLFVIRCLWASRSDVSTRRWL